MSALTQAAWSAIDTLGLSNVAIRIRNWGRHAGFLDWKPLVPINEFSDSCRLAIETLRAGGHDFGDYLEFGVSRGSSLACMNEALRDNDLRRVRCIGFDSFEGMPKDSRSQGWEPGDFRSSIGDTTTYLDEQGTDLTMVRLVKGWFSDTCTPDLVDRLQLNKASIIMIDCDIYSASCEALAFVSPMIQDEAVIIFDDWGWMVDAGIVGQKEAFAQFLADNPDLHAHELEAYRPEARMFHVTRLAASN